MPVTATSNLNGQELTPEEALNALAGNSNTGNNGEPLLDINRNVVNVCFNNNDIDMTTDFTGGAQNLNEGNQAGVNTGIIPPP